MNLKERMKLKNKAKLGKGSSSSSRDRFKKRNQTILDKAYDDRNERSKGATGKTIFKSDLMKKYNINEFSPTIGDRFFEILPISFEPSIPYFFQTAIHFSVGFANDAFICMQKYHKDRCFRCETQSKMWKQQELHKKDDIVALYPSDRICYLIWERTKELINGESPDYTLTLWASPKIKVHAEIQEKARDKLNRITLDISDLSIDGDGRTVGLTIAKKGDFPDYRAFDLIERETPIPNEIIDKLEEIINDANEQGFENCIEMFFDIPTYDDVKESMETEMDDINKEESTSKKSKVKKFGVRSSLKSKKEETNNKEKEEEEFMDQLEELKDELNEMSRKTLIWRKWCKENDYADAISMDKEEAIDAIIDDMYEQFTMEQDKKYKTITEDDVPY